MDVECIREHLTPICEHLEHYYPGVVGEPITYWQIPASLPPDARIEETQSDSGDPCHRQLLGLSNNQSKKFFKRSCRPEDIRVCRDESPIPCNQELLEAIFSS